MISLNKIVIDYYSSGFPNLFKDGFRGSIMHPMITPGFRLPIGCSGTNILMDRFFTLQRGLEFYIEKLDD